MFTPCQKGYKAYGTPEMRARLNDLVHALQASIVCRVTYQTPQASDASTYVLHPYALSVYNDGLYLFAYRPDIEALTVLAVERLQALELVTPPQTREMSQKHQEQFVHFAPQAAVVQEIEARRARAFGIIDDGKVLDVVLRFTPEQAPYVAERTWHATQQVEPQPDGGLLLRFQASGRFEIVRWILGWGPAVEVLAPPALREEVAQRLHHAAMQYSST
jgi:predicted DNA-binding transcriptional regulator YafY